LQTELGFASPSRSLINVQFVYSVCCKGFDERMSKMIRGLILAFSGFGTTLCVAASAWGAVAPTAVTRAPEIDPASAVGAITLLLGGVAVMRSRARRQRLPKLPLTE
jgi:hypothetical protein